VTVFLHLANKQKKQEATNTNAAKKQYLVAR